MRSAQAKVRGSHTPASVILRSAIAFFAFGGTVPASEPPQSLYHWESVRLGAGGFVTGFVSHPASASVRYCRTDVGNAYRWDGREWRPMVVRENGRGMPAASRQRP